MTIVKDTDMGYKNLLKLMKQEKVSADIGIFSDSKDPEGGSIAEYAIKNEMGIGVPERSFTRSTFDEQEKNAFRVIYESLKIDIMHGFSLKRSVGKGAKYMQSEIVKKIHTAELWATPNSKSTIRRKGKNKPLIDKGIMWKAVVWKIRPIGG